MTLKVTLTGVLLTTVFLGCSSTGLKREWLDNSLHKENDVPSFVRNSKTFWQDGDKYLFKTSQQVRGDERVNGCFDLAKLQTKENLVSEIKNDIKGTIDNAQTTLQESGETVLGKVRTAEFGGTLTGLRFTEEFYERFRAEQTERVECYVLSEISLAAYNTTKQGILNKIIAVDMRIKEAITTKQVEFFKAAPAIAIPEKASQSQE
ncbi:hypothetical protein WDW86_00495 [Bdellovibrionota bacterium FG-2]